MNNQVRIKAGESPSQIMKDFFDNRESDLTWGWQTGIVVNNNDPDKQGKCQIRVYGVFGDEVPDSDLPWALPDFSFVGSKVGSFVVPPNGAIVKVYFDQGDIYLPHYSTKAVVATKQPTQKDVDYPNNMVLLETDQGDYVTLNRKTGKYKIYTRSGAQIVLDSESGEATVHGATKVRIDGTDEVLLGDTGGYVVTSPTSGPITTQNGHILTGQERLRA